MLIPTSTHWGNFEVETRDSRVVAIHPERHDTEPSPIGQSLLASQDAGCRIPRPSIRAGWLKRPGRSDGTQRGVEPFVAVPWDEALDMAADALRRVVAEHGNEATFGGSYGWASAGRFHHAQSQLHRFLSQLGGYTYSVQSYSTGTAQVIIPHVLGMASSKLMNEAPTIEDVLKNTRLVVSFGGISMKNTQINQGGIGDHSARAQLQRWRDAGVEIVCISPVRDDVADFLDADWWPIRPNADVPLMLGLAHTLHSEDLHDKDFLRSHCVGYERFLPYLLGKSDGVPKDADWAAALCDIEPARIRALARRMANEPCLLSISWSLQRTENGDQPYWMIAVLGAMLGNLRAARPRRRLRLWLHPQLRVRRPSQRAVQNRRAAPARQSGLDLHPGGAHRRHAARSRRHRAVQRSDPDLSGYPSDLLGRRESVPPPSGSEPPPKSLCEARDHHRQRAVLDRDRAPCGYRFPHDDGARARGFRLGDLRALRRADAPGPRAV